MSKKIHARGVGRVADNEKVLLVSFDRRPTDEELREAHRSLNGLSEAVAAKVRAVVEAWDSDEIGQVDGGLIDDLRELLTEEHTHEPKRQTDA